jgi:hypothetical protein
MAATLVEGGLVIGRLLQDMTVLPGRSCSTAITFRPCSVTGVDHGRVINKPPKDRAPICDH